MAFLPIQLHSVHLHSVRPLDLPRSFVAFLIGDLDWEADVCDIVLVVARCNLPLLPWTAVAFVRTYLPSPPSAFAAPAGLPSRIPGHRVSTSWCQSVVVVEEDRTSSPAHHQTEETGGGPWGVPRRLDAVGGDVVAAADVAVAAVGDDVVAPPGVARVGK